MKRFLLVLLACGAGLAIVPWWVSEFWVSLLMTCMMYATLAVSWSIFSGATRYLSLATTALFGLGAYMSAWFFDSLPWPLLIALGAAVSAGFAALLGAAVLHLRGTYFAILTFGMGELVKHSITYIEKSVYGTVGRVITEIPSDQVIYWTVLLLTILAVLAFRLVGGSRLGLAMRGIGADEQRAATFGVHPRRVKIAGFALSAAFAGAVGAAMAVRWTYIDPHAAFNPFIGFQTVLIAMVGGAATLRGPLSAAIALSLLAEVLRLNFPNAYLILLGLLLILSVLFMPRGLASVPWRRLLSGRRAAGAGVTGDTP